MAARGGKSLTAKGETVLLKTLLRGAATLLTAALLCFNLFYELAPNLVVGPEKKLVFAAAFAVLLRIALFCAFSA